MQMHTNGIYQPSDHMTVYRYIRAKALVVAAEGAARVSRTQCLRPGAHLVGNRISLSFAKWICTQRYGGRAVSTHAVDRVKLRSRKSDEATVWKTKELRWRDGPNNKSVHRFWKPNP